MYYYNIICIYYNFIFSNAGIQLKNVLQLRSEMKSAGKNRVFLTDDEVVELIVYGDQTVESVTQMANEAETLLKKLREEGKPALILDNLMLIGKVPPAARKKVVDTGKHIDYDKLAFVSSDLVIRLSANLVLRAIGKGNKVKYFDDYGQAVLWLTANSNK